MAGRRWGISSPVFYSAVLVCGLAGLYYGVELVGPKIVRWVEQWKLSRGMRSADPRSRLGAVAAMEGGDPDITNSLLVGATGDTDVTVRVAACRLLASRAKSPQTLLISVLSRAAEDASDSVRIDTAKILGRIVARGTVNAQMEHDHVDALAAEAGSQATAILCRLLKDPLIEVRTAAAEAIGEGGPGPPPAELIAAAGDADREVQLAVAKSLLRRNGPDDRTAARILCALIADPGPIADRFQILRLVQGTSKETQERAVQALAGLLSHVDVAVLPDVIACLGESGQSARSALPVLEKLLDDPEPSTRASASMAILSINEKPTPRVLAVLVEMLADKNMPQDWRMDAFGRIKEANPDALARATPALIRQLGDKSPDVRYAAIELLRVIVEDKPAELPKEAAGK
jgi:HEAT repeat protein